MIDLPPDLKARIGDHAITPVTLGKSNAATFRVGDAFFLKRQALGDEVPLSREQEVMQWLRDYVPVPEVIDYEQHGPYEFLLMTAIRGYPACDLNAAPGAVASAHGEALRAFHEQVPAADCPFDQSLQRRVAACWSRANKGLVDLTDLDEARKGWTVTELQAAAKKDMPDREDLVVTHGDYCLPNVIFAADVTLSGFIDLGGCGVADRHQDIALGVRSVADDLGMDAVRPFLEAYGNEVDPALINYYQLLDEFF